jgi:hypothetical protein
VLEMAPVASAPLDDARRTALPARPRGRSVASVTFGSNGGASVRSGSTNPTESRRHTGDERDDSTDASGHSEPRPEFAAAPPPPLIDPRPKDDEGKASADPDGGDHQRPHVCDYPAMAMHRRFSAVGGRGVGRGGRRRAEPSPAEPSRAVAGEGGDEQPGATPTSARLDEAGPGLVRARANYVPVIRVSEATGTQLSTGFSSWGIAGECHSDKESSGTTSDPCFPTSFPWSRDAGGG